MSAYFDRVLADGAVLLLKLGEASGTVADDAGPNNLDGTIAGSGITYGTPGPLLSAETGLTFAGTSDPITVPDNNALDLGDGPLSIEFWFKRSATQGATQCFFNKGTNAYFCRFESDNSIGFRKSGLTTFIFRTAANIVTDQAWHYFCITKNAATTTMQLDLTELTPALGTNATLADTATALNIGFQAAGTVRLPASMFGFALYPTALTSTQRREHYLLATSTFPPVGTVTVEGQAPTPQLAVTSPTGSLTVQGLAPTVSVAQDAATGAVTASGEAPTPTVSVDVDARGITVTGLDPTISVSGSVSVDVDAASIAIEGLEPSVTAFSMPPVPQGGWKPIQLRRNVEVRPDNGRIWVVALNPQLEIESTYEEEVLLLV